LERKLADIRKSGADVVAAANPGCILQIRAGTILDDMPIEIAHPIELLARAHGVRG
jgi:glycolate oxidase iron-sulfur subunit